MDREGVFLLLGAVAMVVTFLWLADHIRGCDHGRFDPPVGAPARAMDIGR